MDRTRIVPILGLHWILLLLHLVYHSMMTSCQMTDVKRQVWVLSMYPSFITKHNVHHCRSKVLESRAFLGSSPFFYKNGSSVISVSQHAYWRITFIWHNRFSCCTTNVLNKWFYSIIMDDIAFHIKDWHNCGLCLKCFFKSFNVAETIVRP